MDVKDVIEKILADAGAEAEKIKAEAKEKAEQLQAELDAELTDFARQTETLVSAAARERKAQILAAARMEIAKDDLAAKKQLLDEVFERAVTAVKNLSDEEYHELMKKLIIEAVVTGDEEIVIGKDEKRIDQKLVKEINRHLGSGFKGNLRLADDTVDIEAGFILRRGKIRTNAGIEVLLAPARENLESKLLAELLS